MEPMNSASSEPKENATLLALTDLARESVRPPTPAQLEEGLDALSARIEEGTVRRTRVLRWSWAGAMAAVSVVAVAGIVWLTRGHLQAPASELAYIIEGGSVIEGGYLRESGSAGVKLLFNEGTEFVLLPGTRGRLRTVDRAGARIAIEQGTASFQVAPRRDAKWLVDVGPFLVTVTGTVFTVSWDSTSERFELRLRHGSVRVTGPVAGGEIALRAGQRLVVNLPQSETLITEQKPEDLWLGDTPAAGQAPAPVPSTEPPAEVDKAGGRAGMGAVAPSAIAKVGGERRWAEALAVGDLDRILADVERAGVKTTLERASSEDLFTLATAARYRRRVGLARGALLAERRRFPTSVRALDAAFLLGRLEEDSSRGTGKAVAWYEEYLSRAPNGTYASEALGRKMIVTSKLAGAAQARPIAEEYLRRFPRGTYAGSARALQRAP
jgi:TolA-binding protein